MNNRIVKGLENEFYLRGNLQNRHVLIYRQCVVKTTNVVFFNERFQSAFRLVGSLLD